MTDAATLQVDGYAGYNRLISPDRVGPDIKLAYCAEEGVKRIGELYRIEAELRGLNQEARLGERLERSAALVADMWTWLTHHRSRVAGKSPLGEALAYIAKCRTASASF